MPPFHLHHVNCMPLCLNALAHLFINLLFMFTNNKKKNFTLLHVLYVLMVLLVNTPIDVERESRLVFQKVNCFHKNVYMFLISIMSDRECMASCCSVAALTSLNLYMVVQRERVYGRRISSMIICIIKCVHVICSVQQADDEA